MKGITRAVALAAAAAGLLLAGGQAPAGAYVLEETAIQSTVTLSGGIDLTPRANTWTFSGTTMAGAYELQNGTTVAVCAGPSTSRTITATSTDTLVSGTGTFSVTVSGGLFSTCTYGGSLSGSLTRVGTIVTGRLFGNECVNTVCSDTYRDLVAVVVPTNGNGLSGSSCVGSPPVVLCLGPFPGGQRITQLAFAGALLSYI